MKLFHPVQQLQPWQASEMVLIVRNRRQHRLQRAIYNLEVRFGDWIALSAQHILELAVGRSRIEGRGENNTGMENANDP
jgi:hypothetical protein